MPIPDLPDEDCYLEPIKFKRFKKKLCVFDTEDDSDGNPLMVDFYDGKRHTFFDLRNNEGQDAATMFILEMKHDILIAHNLEYDLVNIFKNSFFGFIDELVYSARLITAKIGELVLMDSYNWCMMPLKAMGKIVGIEKGDLEASKEDWDEFVKYNQKDTEILYKFCCLFQDRINALSLNLRPTIARMAMDLWRSKYQKMKVPQNSSIYVLNSYYGGRTEAFFIGDLEGDIRVADVRSMYPTAMRNNPFPYGFVKKTKDWTKVKFGIIHCQVEIPEDIEFPPLPIHSRGKLMFPVGIIDGWWTFFELRYALDYGVKLSAVYEAYGTNEECHPFDDYIDSTYGYRQEARKEGDDFGVMLWKLFMNCLYGKYGQHKKGVILKSEVTEADLEIYELKGLCGEFKILEEKDDNISPTSNYIWAAYVTAYARVYLHKAFRTCADAGHKVFYADTDSIFYVHNDPFNPESPFKIGTELGQFEEDKFVRAEVSTLKAYKLTKADGKEKLACKGVPQKYMAEFLAEGFVDIVKPMRMREGMRREKGLNVWGTITKKMQSVYDKREVLESGETKPIVLGKNKKVPSFKKGGKNGKGSSRQNSKK
jgi:hypothetical protein